MFFYQDYAQIQNNFIYIYIHICTDEKHYYSSIKEKWKETLKFHCKQIEIFRDFLFKNKYGPGREFFPNISPLHIANPFIIDGL